MKQGGRLPRRTEIRGCGKRWDSEEQAARSKRALADESLAPAQCGVPGCGGWHLEAQDEGPRVPLKAATRDTGPSMETRAMVYARDLGLCARCGIAVKNIPHSCHHRRLRSQGGTNDFQVLLTMCGSGTTGCHGWAHAHPAEAEEDGYLVRSGSDPLRVPVLYATPDGPERQYLTSDGERVAEPPQGVAA